MDTIGVIADPDQPVFGGAGERLAARGFRVRFFSPGERVRETTIDELSALAAAHADPGSIAALHYADASAVETFNGFVSTTALGNRLVALHALETVGCRVPTIWLSEPAEHDAVFRYCQRWPGARAEAPGFYQEAVATADSRHRYYAVNDGIETHVTAIELRNEPGAQDHIVDEADVTVERATRLRELLDDFGARAIAVDFVRGPDEEWFAVDVDPMPSFSHAGMERHLANALASLTTIGA